MKIISKNKQASFNYFLSDNLECGMSLKGAEVKSILLNGINLKESYVKIINNEVFLISANISRPGNLHMLQKFDETRPKKLLLHKRQIKKFLKMLKMPGTTLIATKVYTADNGKLKCEIALGKGKQNHDKRNSIKERDLKRQAKEY